MAQAGLLEAILSKELRLLPIPLLFGYPLGKLSSKPSLVFELLTKGRSHILMIVAVAALTVHFYLANRSQRKRGNVLENTVRLPLLSLSTLKCRILTFIQAGFHFTY